MKWDTMFKINRRTRSAKDTKGVHDLRATTVCWGNDQELCAGADENDILVRLWDPAAGTRLLSLSLSCSEAETELARGYNIIVLGARGLLSLDSLSVFLFGRCARRQGGANREINAFGLSVAWHFARR